MNRNDVIYLVSEQSGQDEIGQFQSVQKAKKVFAYVSSISQKEWFEGGRNGLNPQYKCSVFFGDYDGEEKVRIGNTTYAIYRTYHKDDEIELYLEERKGAPEVITYSVTLVPNGGEGDNVVSIVHSLFKVPECPFTKERYEAIAWNTKADGTGTTYNFGDTVALNEDLKLFVVWEQSIFTVRYEPNGGSGSSYEVEVEKKYIVPNSTYTRDVPYKFGYWTDKESDGNIYRPGETVSLTKDITLFAQWSLPGAIITQDGNMVILELVGNFTKGSDGIFFGSKGDEYVGKYYDLDIPSYNLYGLNIKKVYVADGYNDIYVDNHFIFQNFSDQPIEEYNLKGINVSKMSNWQNMFFCSKAKKIDISDWRPYDGISSMINVFVGANNLEEIDLTFEGFAPTAYGSLWYSGLYNMFLGTTNLKKIVVGDWIKNTAWASTKLKEPLYDNDGNTYTLAEMAAKGAGTYYTYNPRA